MSKVGVSGNINTRTVILRHASGRMQKLLLQKHKLENAQTSQATDINNK